MVQYLRCKSPCYRDWMLQKLAADAEIAVERIDELLEGDRIFQV
ncbi:hypothetical protein [Coleofasciculus sp. H7-2]